LLNLAEKHKKTVCVGRTHGQHAVPTTYGLKFASWAREVRRHIERLDEIKKRALVGKMTGAVGTQASFGRKGMEIQKYVMDDLGLSAAEVSSQIIQRDRYAELVAILALISATLDKIGREVRNLMRTEIAEVSESFRKSQVGSSTMPHKKNPIDAEKVCGLARVVKSNVFAALENVSLEHERDLTNSSSERVVIPESFVLLDEILKTSKGMLGSLLFFPENIKRNLKLTKGINMAESVMIALTEKGMSRQDAHELLRRLSTSASKEKKELKEVLLGSERVTKFLTAREIEDALNPEKYIGTAVEQVESVLRAARNERKLRQL
ncbi:MAG: adenylosuccinate lyase, partial [Candidatus Hydrothermarchaeaceae archaeon]